MESSGLHPNQVVQVRGYADRKLRKPQQPLDSSNRRITVIIQYLANPALPVASTVSNDGTIPTIK
jgi:chemotaxis protein MotB